MRLKTQEEEFKAPAWCICTQSTLAKDTLIKIMCLGGSYVKAESAVTLSVRRAELVTSTPYRFFPVFFSVSLVGLASIGGSVMHQPAYLCQCGLVCWPPLYVDGSRSNSTWESLHGTWVSNNLSKVIFPWKCVARPDQEEQREKFCRVVAATPATRSKGRKRQLRGLVLQP